MSESGYTAKSCENIPYEENVFTQGFRLINSKINDITYDENHTLNIYANDKLIKSINILNKDIFNEFLNENIFDEIYNELDEKADKIHNHVTDDIIDYEDKNAIEIKQAYLVLANKIRTYGE